MADVFSVQKRSLVMAAIRGKGNKDTELRLVEILKAARISGWRRHPALPGKPDFVFRKHRLAIFVDGCFWHGCAKHGRRPLSNASYWEEKLQRNRRRDRRSSRFLREKGWTVLRLWEHELSNPRSVVAKILKLLA